MMRCLPNICNHILMKNAEDVHPRPQPPQQKPTSSFKFLKPLILLAVAFLIALIVGPVGYLLSSGAIQGLGSIHCRGGSWFVVTVQVPNQWMCEPDDYGFTLRSKLFTVEISILARLPACSAHDPDCIVSEFYADDNLSLKLKTIKNKDLEIFGDYNDYYPVRISVTYKDMETRKLTESEKRELVMVLNAVKFEEKPFHD
jgi:hypothetical protein